MLVREGAGPRWERRAWRSAGSRWLSAHSTLKRVRECGNMLSEWVELKQRGDVAHYAQLRSCGSPWSCPVCAAKISAGRVEEVRGALDAARKDGWTVGFLTTTMSHHRGQDLKWLRDTEQEAFRLLTASRTWRRLRAEWSLEYVRSREHTWGQASGWHPHSHFALLFKGVATKADFAGVEAVLSAEYRACLVRVGLSGSVGHALRLEVWDDTAAQDLGGYLTKQLALEVAGGMTKEGRQGRWSMWDLLGAARDGEVAYVALWREHEAATSGQRTISWSQGMRKYRPVIEASDEELAAVEVGGDLVAAFDRVVKKAVWADSPRGVALLEWCEVSPQLAVQYLCQVSPDNGRIVLPVRPGYQQMEGSKTMHDRE